eukprot:TRINITY_DN13220_c0_g1_i5.p1 TRINITY_DN13220_c0_g1~~TRINITY_DN13220_c0_g1_i5.p1  ORF type:complete len:360 (+),score=56.84 TRINITY_DN13220_c0_g1_i5:62-1141(+)
MPSRTRSKSGRNAMPARSPSPRSQGPAPAAAAAAGTPRARATSPSRDKVAASGRDRGSRPCLRGARAEKEEAVDMKSTTRRLGVTVVRTYPLRGDGEEGGRGPVLHVSSGSVVDFRGDAIVNAANTGCLGGGGVDGAVSAAGGPALAEARKKLPVVDGRLVRCPIGEARMTIGGALKARWCIHAVGPNYGSMMQSRTMRECDELLHGAYRASMDCAAREALRSIGFSLLSAGIFRGQQKLSKIMSLAAEGVRDGIYPGLQEVHLIAYSGGELKELVSACDRVFQEVEAAPAATVSVAGAAEAPSAEAGAVTENAPETPATAEAEEVEAAPVRGGRGGGTVSGGGRCDGKCARNTCDRRS